MDERSATVLIVDDATANLEVAMGCLAEGGFRTMVARSGETGLQIARDERPDLILLDVMMPDLNGFEVCQRLKADAQIREIPVIFMTASTTTIDKVEGFRLGAVDYVTKPFAPEELLARVWAHLTIARLQHDLQAANAELERRVAARTAELHDANALLRRELAERKKAEEALRESELKYRSLLQKIQVAVVVHAADTRIVICNFFAQTLLGLTEDQLLGKTVFDLGCRFFREDGTMIPVDEYPVNQVAATRQSVKNMIVGVRRPGNARDAWVMINASPVVNPENKISEIIVTLTDVTERRRDQEKINHLASIVESSDDAIFGNTLETTIVSWNRGAERIYGYTAAEIVGRSVAVLAPPELQDEVAAIMERLKRGERVERLETIRLCKDGRSIHVALTISPLMDAGGRTVGSSTIARDITDQKEYAERIRKAHEYTEMILNAIPDPVFAKDRNHRFTLVNDAFSALLGQPRAVLLGKTDSDVRPADQAEAFWKKEALVLAGGEEDVDDGTITDPCGGIHIVQTKRILAAPDTLVGVIRDLTGVKQLTIARDIAENARLLAEAANKAKSVFLANMSHELRTPLNAILGFSSLMQRDPDITSNQMEKLDIINRSGNHLLTLINDILEMAKIEAGRAQLEIAPFDLGTLVRDVTDMMRLRAEEKGLTLLLDQSSSFPRFIKGDVARLRQILVNLVGNAVKFTEHGGVTLRLGTSRNARHHLVMDVEDTGIGIRDEDQDRLFQPFVQLTRLGAGEGAGLGLAITRQYVELMGGSIAVKSTLGAGSVFQVDVPVELVEEADAVPVAPGALPEAALVAEPGQPAFRVLIAEDQCDNQMLLLKLMAEIGLEARLTANGEDCIALFQEWHPHLIWMDRRMPLMDGMEAARRIRQLADGGDVTIIAVTASAFEEQRQELIDAGMDDFIRKPYRIHEIYDALTRHLGLRLIHKAGSPGAVSSEQTLSDDLSPNGLAALPADLRAELKEAVTSLRTWRIADVAQRIGDIDSPLGNRILRMAKRFEHQAILDAIAGVDAS